MKTDLEKSEIRRKQFLLFGPIKSSLDPILDPLRISLINTLPDKDKYTQIICLTTESKESKEKSVQSPQILVMKQNCKHKKFH